MTFLITALLLSLSICLDSFLALFSYGASKIRIPISSFLIIDLIGTLTLFLSLYVGTFLKQWIPYDILPILRFVILVLMGMIRLFDSFIKSYIRKHGTIKNHLRFSFFNLHFILEVYSSPLEADADASLELTPKEAIILGCALSLDGLLIGVGAAFTQISISLTVLLTFIIGFLFSYCGYKIGNKMATKLPFDFSFLSGFFLLVLAFLNI